jgi:hypothetical protein
VTRYNLNSRRGSATIGDETFRLSNSAFFISNRGFTASRKVTIERNKEISIDLGGEEVEEVWTGMVIFTVSPAEAKVYIDGELTDISGVVELEFGLHQIVCEAEGYDTISQYIKVSQDIASISITMEVARTDTSNDNSVSGNDLVAGSTRVYIDYPIDVEIYVDGVYMGLSPLYFEKKAGSHSITLRREGYITKSYTVYLDDDDNDVTYSFSALERNIETGEETDTDNDHSVSGNNVP